MAIKSSGFYLHSFIVMFIYMMSSGRKAASSSASVNCFPLCLFSVFTEIRFLLYILCIFFIICWGTSSLARISNNFLLLNLSKAFLKSVNLVCVSVYILCVFQQELQWKLAITTRLPILESILFSTWFSFNYISINFVA